MNKQPIVIHLIRRRFPVQTIRQMKVETIEKNLRGRIADLIVIESSMLISTSLLNTMRLVVTPTNGKVINLRGETIVY